MDEQISSDLEVVQRWCESKGEGWSVLNYMGDGGTATVYAVQTPKGALAFKLYNLEFSGPKGEESERRLAPQLKLGLHDCPYMIRTHEGGRFEDRLFTLLDLAEGRELEKCLTELPRDRIHAIIDQIARAAQFLREQGLSHRDLKSANVFISDDFERVKVLDLSVLRDIHDPVGIGTDHGGGLPVVATSRYCPPEYLFRLIEPSPEAWHALDIYQLGGILHDLIMRKPMFSDEYGQTRDTNRYRFAWIVATQEPMLQAQDVGANLISLARRALDKDWERRSTLKLRDFFRDEGVLRDQALSAIGFGDGTEVDPMPLADTQRLMTILGREVEEKIVVGLMANGVTCVHQITGADAKRTLSFAWQNATSPTVEFSSVEFVVELNFGQNALGALVSHNLILKLKSNGAQKEALLSLPDVTDMTDASTRVASASMAALGDLAKQTRES